MIMIALLLRLPSKRLLRACVLTSALTFAACTTSNYVAAPVVLTSLGEEIAEERLLDIGIIELDPGLPEEGKPIPDDVYADIRRAEARYFPYHLKTTLQNTGHWGVVNVIPNNQVVADLYISGTVLKSDGNRAQVEFTVADITGREWMRRRYNTRTDRAAYARSRDRSEDPYQNLFNEFANDLLAEIQTYDQEQIDEIRTASRMSFYAQMAPSVFADYVERDKRDLLQVVRLPADEDPMVRRLDLIRERDALFINTLNEHYANFYYGIALPYEGWRSSSREAQIEYQRLRRSALLRGLVGIAAVAAATEISRGDANDSGTERRTRSTLKNLAISEGVQLFASSFGRLAEARLQQQSIAELSESFGQEAAPMVVEVEGQTRRLTGTASAQYDQWRELLRKLNEQETGLLAVPQIDINGRLAEQDADADDS